jgi:hypothetical protein
MAVGDADVIWVGDVDVVPAKSEFTHLYGIYPARVSQTRKVGTLKRRKRKVSENVILGTLL